jgi:hypothetical protein
LVKKLKKYSKNLIKKLEKNENENEEETINNLDDLESDDDEESMMRDELDNYDIDFDGNDEDENEVTNTTITNINEQIKKMSKKEIEKMDEEEEKTNVIFKDNIKDKKTLEMGNQNNKNLDKKEINSLYVLPLYSMLTPEKQLKVFEEPPEVYFHLIKGIKIMRYSNQCC